MFSNQNSNTETAIARFRQEVEIEVNKTTVFACYISGYYTHFFAREEEAITHCKAHGCEFNGQWIQSTYSVYKPGELIAVVGIDSVYSSMDRSKFIDPAMGRWQIPFVEWEKL